MLFVSFLSENHDVISSKSLTKNLCLELKNEALIPQNLSKAHVSVSMIFRSYIIVENCQKMSGRCRDPGEIEANAELLPSPPRHTL